MLTVYMVALVELGVGRVGSDMEQTAVESVGDVVKGLLEGLLAQANELDVRELLRLGDCHVAPANQVSSSLIGHCIKPATQCEKGGGVYKLVKEAGLPGITFRTRTSA